MNRTTFARLAFALLCLSAAATRVPAQATDATRAPSSRPRLTATFYEMRDILSARANLRRGAGTAEAALVQATDDLMRAVKTFMEPRFVSGATKLGATNGTLVTSLGDEQQAWLQAFLLAQRARPLAMVRVECHAALVPDAGVAALGMTGAPLPLETAAQRDAFIKKLEATPGAVVLPTQSTPLLAGTMGGDEMYEEVQCITGYMRHEHVQPGDQTLVVPTIEVVRAGLFLSAMPVLLAEGRIGCSLTLTHRMVEKPIAQKPTPLGPVLLPVVTTTTVEATATFAPGATIAFAGAARDGMRAIITITVTNEPMESPPGESDHDKK